MKALSIAPGALSPKENIGRVRENQQKGHENKNRSYGEILKILEDLDFACRQKDGIFEQLEHRISQSLDCFCFDLYAYHMSMSLDGF